MPKPVDKCIGLMIRYSESGECQISQIIDLIILIKIQTFFMEQ